MGCDALLTALLYALLRASGMLRAGAKRVSLLWWLNPLAIVNSSVQASWDSLIPLSLLFTTWLALSGRWYAAGAMLALGVQAKLVPLVWLCAAPALLLTRVRGPGEILARIARFCCGAACVSALILLPLISQNQLTPLRQALFTRAGTFTIGGANLTAVLALRPFDNALQWADAHRSAVAFTSSTLLLIGTGFIAIALLRRRVLDMRAPLLALFSILALLFLTSPFTQPSYTIWMIPLMLMIARYHGRSWYTLSALLSLFSFVFLATVRGIGAIVLPTCVFFHQCDPLAMALQAQAYRNTPGYFSNFVQLDIDAICGELIGVTVLLAFILALRELTRAHPSDAEIIAPAQPAAPGAWACVLTAIAAFIAIPPALAFPPPESLSGKVSGQNVLVRAYGYVGSLHAVRRPSSLPAMQRAYAYFDTRYTYGRGVSAGFAHGFLPHLQTEFTRRHLSITAREIHARSMRLLLQRSGIGTSLIIAGGLLPHDVSMVLLRRWIAGGGTLFWAGAPLTDFPTMHFPGDVKFHQAPPTFGKELSRLQPLASIDFDKTTFSPNALSLERMHGAALGYLDELKRSSISTFPWEHGRIILFGDCFDDETQAANSIAQMLYTGAWSDARSLREEHPAISPTSPVKIRLRKEESLKLYGDAPDHQPFMSWPR